MFAAPQVIGRLAGLECQPHLTDLPQAAPLPFAAAIGRVSSLPGAHGDGGDGGGHLIAPRPRPGGDSPIGDARLLRHSTIETRRT